MFFKLSSTPFLQLALTVFALLSSSVFAYNVTPNSLTVSGISSGAFMAGQFQIAYSSQVKGAAFVAGGLYYCSEGNALRASRGCMKASKLTPKVEDIVNQIFEFEGQGKVDALVSVKDDKVFLMTGTKDTVVDSVIVKMTEQLMLKLGVSKENIAMNDTLSVGHAFPTLDYGNPCSTASSTPFISACKFDGAEAIFKHLYGTLQPKQKASVDNFLNLPQKTEQVPVPAEISMAEIAKVYVPVACQKGELCKIHIAFHGCSQTTKNIGDQYYIHAGFNEWAESNHIIVLYPQIEPNGKRGNPLGCWDWTGYTGQDFATKSGRQMQVVLAMVEFLSMNSQTIKVRNQNR